MIGRLLSLDLSSKGYTVVNIHVGIARTIRTTALQAPLIPSLARFET